MTTRSTAATLGIDFGTSNSAAGILLDGKPHLIELEAGHQTVPTALFFDFVARKVLYGNAASKALVAGEEGRFMRALKSVLGTALMRETRHLMNETLTFIDIISRFLAEVKTRAEAATGQTFDYALSGRPVHFHSTDEKRNIQAAIDLRDCYAAAGFKDVQFMFEPEAAARAYGPLPGDRSIGLIVDIGGGTSDFSLFRNAPGGGAEIIVNHGTRVGGTDFDRSLSVDHVMPLFGRGAQIRKELGAGLLTAPNAMFQDLATWEKIPFLYAGTTRRDVRQLQKLAVEPLFFERLGAVLDNELGHDVAFAVERGKIATNANGAGSVDLGVVEPRLTAPLTGDSLTQSLDGYASKICEAAAETLTLAQCRTGDVDTVIFVGGSSLMSIVETRIARQFPNATLNYANAFTAVIDGLAISSATAFQ
ncbi:Hsp70 family protein [Actibacterium sp. 188UL27-1]|uniref:Hsp70 family protein n=1 Tax=Actibacterium sp. 188UL27-1 TaxID=2786961 RepID=UPI0019582134|nr:Hsp70 family protein [Actibacterium sp. 188UL27-1]MBM7069381.1 Hsp70 family protein [Actibacterium sp. 188UL27-1]